MNILPLIKDFLNDFNKNFENKTNLYELESYIVSKGNELTEKLLVAYQPPCTESAGFVVMTESHTMLKHTILSKNIINIIILIFYIFFYHILCYFSYTSTKISRRPHVLTPKLFS